jgi:hypothetical protein
MAGSSTLVVSPSLLYYYNGTKDIIFGSASSQEMCMAFVVYYTASTTHLSCSYRSEDAADYSSAPVENVSLLGRWFGEKPKKDMVPAPSMSSTGSTTGGWFETSPEWNRVTWTVIVVLCSLLFALSFIYAIC